MTSALQSLASSLCPWLEPAFQQFETALEQGRLGHAWLIFGQQGVGKLNLALVLAHRLLGASAAPSALDPDVALAALAVRHGPTDHHPDLHWLHPEDDKETISIDQVREVIRTLSLTAHRGKAKVVIIEPAEAMTTPAANALLKTLEEPAGDSYLLLLSHRPGRLPATIRSRCQHLGIKPPPPETVAEWLRVPLGAVGDIQRSVGAAPLAVAAAIRDNDSHVFNMLESDLSAISEDRVDPLAVAQSWVKDHTGLSLIWLGRRLHDELRSRQTGAGGSTEVTVPLPATLHNAWRDVPSRTLFEQYDRAERLLSQLGSGINVELALQALLSAFQVNRGKT